MPYFPFTPIVSMNPHLPITRSSQLPSLTFFSSTLPLLLLQKDLRPRMMRCTFLTLPVISTISTIAICPISNRFAVATATEVSIWACYSSPLNSSISVERVLEIDVLRNVCQLALFEDYLGKHKKDRKKEEERESQVM
jgi:hypothetical protein